MNKEQELQEIKIELNKLENKIDAVKSNLSTLQYDKTNLMIREFTLKTGIEIGSEIKLKELRGLVYKLERDYQQIVPFMRFYKKDGTLGSRQKKIYSWDLPHIEIINKS